jgi:prephenate dehydrogenase
MTDPAFLRTSKIVIIGLGLMGGSLAQAIQPYCQKIYGIDTDPEAIEDAIKSGIFEAVSCEPMPWFSTVDLIVLAAPVKVIVDLIEQIPEWHPGKAMVIDLGSTKESIVAAMEAMPERFDPLGGHPMCGKEISSFKSSDASLFEGHPFILTPLKRTSQKMLQFAEEIIDCIGANTIYLDPVTHDRWVSATSHVPHIIANSLAAVTPSEAASLIGPGFRSSARLAATSTKILLDILQTNRLNILTQITAFEHHLCVIKNLLESEEYSELAETLDQGKRQYHSLLRQ